MTDLNSCFPKISILLVNFNDIKSISCLQPPAKYNFSEVSFNNILKSKKGVIALGGGAFITRAIKNEVLESHLSFWLNWKIDTLVKRIKNSKKRPLAVNSTKNELIEIIKKRSVIYSKALYKINCENFTKQQIAKKIIDIYEAN